jgi:hypothetical protein
VYSNGELRDIMLGRHEVVRRIYFVFQDLNWTARPWVISREQVLVGKDAFEITFDARGTFDAEPFHWRGTLSGDSDGTVSFDVDGSTDATFVRNRLGLCVLHPMDVAGQPCVVETVAGASMPTVFPLDISPQQPFVDVRTITHEVLPGAWASTRLIGETFETEDHRNWSDASYKTYATPISLPFPVEVQADSELWQSVAVAIDWQDVTVDPAPTERVITVESQVTPRPGIGLQIPADAPPPTDTELARLRDLGLSHLRIDVRTSDPLAAQRVKDGAGQAESIGASLVVALLVEDAGALPILAGQLAGVPVDTWLVFDAAAKVAGTALAAAARSALGPHVRLGGGTNLYFTELNREPQDTAAIDVMAFSLNPQVHATDHATLVQNLAAQGVVAANARRLAGGAAIHVGPVTLRPRFNPNATDIGRDVSGTALPGNVDVRQPSQFCAAWTAISLKYLAEAGTLDDVTYYETTGWRGVMERAEGTSQPSDFASTPGATFPVYDALAAMRGFTHVRRCTSSLPQEVDALLLEHEGARRLLLANFTEEQVEVSVVGLDGLSTVSLPPVSLEVVDIGRAAA